MNKARLKRNKLTCGTVIAPMPPVGHTYMWHTDASRGPRCCRKCACANEHMSAVRCFCGEWKNVCSLFHESFIFQRNVIKSLRSFLLSDIMLEPREHCRAPGQWDHICTCAFVTQTITRLKVVDMLNFK